MPMMPLMRCGTTNASIARHTGFGMSAIATPPSAKVDNSCGMPTLLSPPWSRPNPVLGTWVASAYAAQSRDEIQQRSKGVMQHDVIVAIDRQMPADLL